MEGIIKKISIEPVELDPDHTALCVAEITFSAKQLAELYEKNNIDITDFISVTGDVHTGSGSSVTVNLSEAAADNMTLTQRTAFFIGGPDF